MEKSQYIYQIFNNIHSKTSILEWIGFIFCILQVVYAYANKSINYLFGIFGTLITIYIFFQGKLYAEMGVNVYYFIMSIYGWINWQQIHSSSKQLPISNTTLKEKQITFLIILLSFSGLGIILKKFTDSDVPFLDALVSSFAWAGMWLLAKRKIENWIILNISNFIAIFLLWYKEFYLYSILSLILFCIAIGGYLNWKKLLHTPKE